MRCQALPALRHLVIAEELTTILPRLLTAPVTKRLESLGFVLAGVAVGFTAEPLATALAMAPVQVLTLQIRPDWHTTNIRFERGAAGYERMWIELGETEKSAWNARVVDEALEILRDLPPSLREIRVKTRKHLDTASAVRLREAIARVPSLAVRELA
jgi:hypothetical protein